MTVRFTIFSISFALALSLAACISAPDVVLLDRKTILEEQAAGELLTLANALRESAIVPQAVPYTRGQLEAAGTDLSHDALGRLVQLQQIPLSEIDYLDNLLVGRCIGEARSGLLIETPATCTGPAATVRTSAAVQRVNRSRKQLWRYLQEHNPESSSVQIRDIWRQRHLQALVCGGQVQQDSGEWDIKQCE
ncbi:MULTISPECIES: DUF1318 domain-containing protein [Methylotuvimicrobium]|uniref:Lipoprotein n=2 Tax=Methylotuvimicrobium TaxID=2822410 RepID=G4SZR6_META2|nr:MULTISPECIES: DUF1318 domain-containing protein [Methylotuvimicrobium]QCW84482.1 DUF1318 domain-containing protein [Methylotuvimicrobium buryatense]CCE25516.1 putative lipoprotein [Methylotuvimicrobium alcaliphilum 20Z]